MKNVRKSKKTIILYGRLRKLRVGAATEQPKVVKEKEDKEK